MSLQVLNITCHTEQSEVSHKQQCKIPVHLIELCSMRDFLKILSIAQRECKFKSYIKHNIYYHALAVYIRVVGV